MMNLSMSTGEVFLCLVEPSGAEPSFSTTACMLWLRSPMWSDGSITKKERCLEG